MQYIIHYIAVLCLSLFFTGCKKYLEEKPDKSFLVPSTVADISHFLDDNNSFNIDNYPSVGEQLSDDYFMYAQRWAAMTDPVMKDNYLRIRNPNNRMPWTMGYRIVYQANVALEELEKMRANASDINEWNRLKGSALFFRAFALFEMAQVFAKPYDAAQAETDLGLPLRLTTDYNERSVRSSVAATYARIIEDLITARQLVPSRAVYKTRPSLSAVFGLLSRTYLSMREYELAGKYADSCLQLQNTLIDYNLIDASSSVPFPVFGEEVIFEASASISANLSGSRARVDTILLSLYDEGDIRRTAFFRENADHTFSFKSGYTGSQNIFVGIAVDEMLLNRAETFARSGDIEAAMADINRLRQHRFDPAFYVPLTPPSSEEALDMVLNERRKELVFRCLRWIDLRRFNKEGRNIILTRKIGEDIYTLLPDGEGYVCLIPEHAIRISGMQQN